jgi:adenosylcobinamide-GDP ribazoletransferase
LTAILSAALLSRAAMPALMATLPNARRSGLSHSTGPCPVPAAGLAAAIALAAALLLLGWSAIGVALVAATVAVAVGLLARAKIGGQTGDVLGATQQVTEIAVLFALIA